MFRNKSINFEVFTTECWGRLEMLTLTSKNQMESKWNISSQWCYLREGLNVFFNKNEFGMKYFVIVMKNAYNCLNKKIMLIIFIYTIYKFLKVWKFLENSMFHFYKFSWFKIISKTQFLYFLIFLYYKLFFSSCNI
jgi:hypothetical protein